MDYGWQDQDYDWQMLLVCAILSPASHWADVGDRPDSNLIPSNVGFNLRGVVTTDTAGSGYKLEVPIWHSRMRRRL